MNPSLRNLAPLIALLIAACGAREEPAATALRPVRGLILISIDTLRADALGLYGSERDTSPFLDRLAERSTVFDNAFCQVPATLPSHLSIFTGLYPTEHGVSPPADVLSAEIPTLPELFRDAGFRTFGHSEGGFVQGGNGFARGFEEWSAVSYAAETDIERTLQRGLDSLDRLRDGERFFLFLHSYSVHDPYRPPPGFAGRYWDGAPPPGAFEASGPNFAAYNGHLLDAPPQAAGYYRALYDEGVRFADHALERFFAELERRGLAGETVVVVTSDHGEEFLDHGRYVHTQAYPESLRIPLIVHHPSVGAGVRIEHLAQSIDLLPTLAEIAGLTPAAPVSGRSLVPFLTGADGQIGGYAYGQNKILGVEVRTVVRPIARRLHQLYVSRPQLESDGFWVSRSISFDALASRLDFRAVAYHQRRAVEVLVDGEVVTTLEIDTDWRPYSIVLGTDRRRRRVELRTPGCVSPARLAAGSDPRCHSFKLDGLDLRRVDLFDLASDPGARHDLSFERPDLVRLLSRELRSYPEKARFAASQGRLSEEQIRDLRALGYLQ